jgi:Protein of unknown function (DUF2815)
MAKTERVRLLTPMFRASFPDVFQKRVFQGQGEESGRYACAALFSGFSVKDGRTIIKVPEAWSPKDQEKWKALIAACNKVSIETFKKPMSELDRAVYKLPFHRGEEKEYAGYGPGVVYVTMSAKNIKPTVVGRDLTTPLGSEEFYAGCFARASVTPFAFNNIGKGIALGLNHLQKLKDGERLDSFRSAEDDFGSDPAEFEDDADSGEADGGAAADFE